MMMMESAQPKDIYHFFKFSRQQLKYWRTVGLFSASERTEGGHYRYSYQDVVALKTIATLKKSGFSIQHIKKVFFKLKKRFDDLTNPFVQKSIIIVNGRIAYVHGGKLYDAITGQGFLFETISSEEIEYKARRDVNRKKPGMLSGATKQKNIRTITSAKRKLLFEALRG